MSFQQWLAIIQASAAEYRQDKTKEFAAECPNEGEPLRAGPDGQLYCPYDGWRPGQLADTTE